MSLQVFGAKIRIETKDLSDTHAEGLFYPCDQKISIDKALRSDRKFQVLMHEIIHAILHRTGMTQTTLSHDVEELVCQNVSVWMTENIDFVLKQSLACGLIDGNENFMRPRQNSRSGSSDRESEKPKQTP